MIPVTAATITRWQRCVLAALGLAASGLLQAQTPELSTVLAMSGSRIPDGVIRGPDGALYGASAASTSETGALFFRVTPDGSSVSTLYQFDVSDGLGPAGALVLGSDDRFYGTTQASNGGTDEGGGTVFRVAPDGSGFTKLYEFAPTTSENVNSNPVNTDGVGPLGALIEGSSDGSRSLYGVTRFGGPNGAGTVYKIGRDGSGFAVLHAFSAITSAATAANIVNADGAHPRAALVESEGYLYGTTNAGGANGQGTIFRLGFDGSFSVLHVFTTPVAPSGSSNAVNEDGAAPQTGLTDGGDGLLYGTTTVGGANGRGVVYSITPDGSVRTTLHDFAADDGTQPISELLLGTDGRLYGTTSAGGETSGGEPSTLGTVYSIGRDGSDDFTKLADFETATGSAGNGRMVQLDSTEFIGTTTNGGRCGAGTIFRLSLAGTTVTGDTTCGQSSGGGGGGAASWFVLLLFATLAPAALAPQLVGRCRAAPAAGSSNVSEAHRLSQSAPRSRPPRTM
jgi:uncharacterized repeat protein (TIGR03803 family)